MLAQQLKKLTIENSKLSDKATEKTKELEQTIKERDMLKDVVERSKQPYSYLVKRIEELELEIMKLKKELTEKETLLTRAVNENQLQDQRVNMLQDDLKSVLLNRKKLESIEAVILKFSNIKEGGVNNSTQKPLLMSTETAAPFVGFEQQDVSKDKLLTLNQSKNMQTNGKKFQQVECKEQEQVSIEQIPQWYLNLKMKNKLKASK